MSGVPEPFFVEKDSEKLQEEVWEMLSWFDDESLPQLQTSRVMGSSGQLQQSCTWSVSLVGGGVRAVRTQKLLLKLGDSVHIRETSLEHSVVLWLLRLSEPWISSESLCVRSCSVVSTEAHLEHLPEVWRKIRMAPAF